MKTTLATSRFSRAPSLLVCFTLTLGLAGASRAQHPGSEPRRGASYELRSFTVDGGGGASRSDDGRHEMSVTLGQPDAASVRGGDYEMDGGFWEVPAAVTVAALSLLSCLGLLALLAGSGASSLRRSLRPRRISLAAATLALSCLAGMVAAEPLDNSFTVQGQLLLDGAPVNGSLSMTFKLYDNPTDLTALGTQSLPAVQVTDGGFNVALDFGAGVFDGQRRWLGISIGQDPEMTPRQELTAAPHALYALDAANAGSLDGLLPSSFAMASHQHAADEISSGTLADARIPAAIARDSEIVSSVLGADGTGSGLDADLLDGLSTGNSSGNIPLNNGTLNTNLDADFLDGLSSSEFLRTHESGEVVGTLTINNDGGADALLSETGIDRNAAAPSTFTIQNSNSGAANTIQLQVEGGAAASAPAYSFTGDADTGVLRSADNTLAFAAGGTQVASIATSGLTSTTTAVSGVALKGMGPGSAFGEGVQGVTGNGGRGVIAQNTAQGTALLATSATGDHMRADTTTSLIDLDPVFRLSNGGNLFADGILAAGHNIITTTSQTFNSFGDPNTVQVTAAINSQGDLFVGDDLEVHDNLHVTTGTLVVGAADPNTPLPQFNSFGDSANKDEAGISSTNDVYVEGGLEVDGGVFVGGSIRADGNLSVAGSDPNDTDAIFFDSGTDESLIWDEGGGGQLGRFELSDELALDGILSLVGAPSILFGSTQMGALVWAEGSSVFTLTGDLNVGGFLSKAAGSFKIDHPLDPENKYLYHSFVESPDMMNVYNGNVTTNAEGYATVELPAWFEALNRDFRYQLTVIDSGDEFALAKIHNEIAGNRFTIRTSEPHVKVSWQVTGIRQDAYAQEHRIPVEEDKSESERGKYLYPAEHGQPEERGVNHQVREQLMRRGKASRRSDP